MSNLYPSLAKDDVKINKCVSAAKYPYQSITNEFINNWDLVSAQPVSTQREGVKEDEVDHEKVSTSQQSGPDICTGALEIHPELKPQLEKIKKREEEEEEIEEGEIIDSSDEERDEHQSAELSHSDRKSCDAPVNDIEMKNEEQASGNQGIIEDMTVSAEGGEAAKDSSEVSVTKEDALTVRVPSYSSLSACGNESASAMTAAGPDDNVHLSR